MWLIVANTTKCMQTELLYQSSDSIEKVRKTIRKGLETKERLKLKDDRFVLISRKHNLGDRGLDKLSSWPSQYPVLAAAYEVKERFHDIYSYPSKDDAMRAAEEWEASIPNEVAWAFREVKGALRSWWDEIFNYYDRPTSNAYKESINNLAKGMNRIGRGYSFDVTRARLLFDDEARRDTRTTVRKKTRKAVQQPSIRDFNMGMGMARMTFPQTTYEDSVEESVIEYGPYIPTLVKNSKRAISPDIST